MADMTAKGRRRTVAHSGEMHCGAKLTRADVMDIRREAENRTRFSILARRYSVTWQCISAVVTRRTWRSVA
jgi:prephenate dehydratase